MPDKFQNKYRIPSARLQGWDYGSNAVYFVTICTKDRECFFGEIVETQNFASQQQPTMQFSPIGKIANDYWLEIPKHFPFVKLDEFVTMPNHVHGIIIIDKRDDDGDRRDAKFCVSTGEQTQPSSTNTFGPQSKNLASIIRGYKSAVKKYATINNINFAWQSRFHDHIIRDNQSFNNISNYIINNPGNWAQDQFFR